MQATTTCIPLRRNHELLAHGIGHKLGHIVVHHRLAVEILLGCDTPAVHARRTYVLYSTVQQACAHCIHLAERGVQADAAHLLRTCCAHAAHMLYTLHAFGRDPLLSDTAVGAAPILTAGCWLLAAG